jgi:hypothetical protein
MFKNLVILIAIVIGTMGCKISKMKYNDIDKRFQCDNFYLYNKAYKSKYKKKEIISQWENNGYTVSDTSSYEGKWELHQTRIKGKCDTIEYISFQMWELKSHTKIYFNGICLKNEKKQRKTQKELKNLKKSIEEEFLKSILLD